MDERDQWEMVCKPQLDRIERKLDSFQPIIMQVDRHEQSLAVLRRVVWTLVGGITPIGLVVLMGMLRQYIRGGGG